MSSNHCTIHSVTPDAAAIADDVTLGAGHLLVDCSEHGAIGSVMSGGIDEKHRVDELLAEHRAATTD